MEEPYFEIVLITQKRFRIVKLINWNQVNWKQEIAWSISSDNESIKVVSKYFCFLLPYFKKSALGKDHSF